MGAASLKRFWAKSWEAAEAGWGGKGYLETAAGLRREVDRLEAMAGELRRALTRGRPAAKPGPAPS